MTETARQVIELARKLSLEEREEVIDTLIEDIDPEGEYSDAEIEEWVRRREAVRADPSQSVDADEVMAELRARRR
jgi:putative addiction module component (TIGR02574 family)